MVGRLERQLRDEIAKYSDPRSKYSAEDVRKTREYLGKVRSVFAHARKVGLPVDGDLTGVFPKEVLTGISTLEKKMRAAAAAEISRADELSGLMDDIEAPINGVKTRKRYDFNEVMKGLKLSRPIAARIFSAYGQETINQTQYDKLSEYVILSDPKNRKALARLADVSVNKVRSMNKTLLRKGLVVNLGNGKKKSKAYAFLPKNRLKICKVLSGE